MTWLTMLKLVPWRYVAYGAGVLALIALGWRVSVWRDAYTDGLPEAQAALAREVACETGSQCAERVAAAVVRQEAINDSVVQGYEDELAGLRARTSIRRPVRLCVPAGSGGVQVPPVAGGTGQGTAAAGLVQPGTGPDLGPQLFDLAARADELSAQCRAIIRRDRALAGE